MRFGVDLLVPSEFPTIQAAVDAASPAGGDTVTVGPGEFAGAVLTNPVRIVGSGLDTRITSASRFGNVAFYLDGADYDLDGSEIRNLVIEYEGLRWAVYSTYVDNGTIRGVTVRNAYRATDVRLGNGWHIAHNTIIGLKSPPHEPARSQTRPLHPSTQTDLEFHRATGVVS